MRNYIIVGDTEKHGECLIYVCANSVVAEQVLDRMLNNPDEEDKIAMRTHKNIRIKKTDESRCWWDDPFLAN